MKRALLIAVVVAVAAALPATAGAAQWRGVVVAKEKNRGTIVTASRSGVVRTIRVESGLGKVHVGQRVAVKAKRLADGTFSLQKIRVVGKAAKARLRATVVRHQTRLGRIVVSAGGSVFALRSKSARRLAHDDDDGFEPGDRIDAHLSFDDDEFEVDDADEVGHAGLLELEGIYLETADGKVKLAVVHRGAVSVTVPGSFVLPPLAAGDELELLVSVGADGSFTLVSLENETSDDEDEGEDEGEDHGVDLDEGDDEVEVKGTFVGVVGGVVSVQTGSGSAVQCNLNGGVVPAGITAGDFVEMECDLVDGKLVVKELEEEDEADDEDELEDHDSSGSDDDEADDDEDDHSGPGSSDDDDDKEEDHSGLGGSDD